MVQIKGNPKVIYASMMNVRKFILSYGAQYLAKAVAIAIRYSHIRQQFKNSKGEENYVIDY